MRKLTVALVAALSGVLIWMAAPAAAGPIVDPGTLEPEPPPKAVCREDGPKTICETVFVVEAVNEPIIDLDLPCGTIYETIDDLREGIRWYVDGKLVKRFVSQNADGTWSLSPTGEGPTVTIAIHANWRNEYAIPGDESSGPEVLHGSDFNVRAPGFGVIAHVAGLKHPDGTHRGVLRFIDEPQAAMAVCAALTT